MAAMRPILIGVLTLLVVWGAVMFFSHRFGDGDENTEVDFTDHQAVCRAALEALARPDFDAVEPFMTEKGWLQLQRDMRLARADMGDPKRAEVLLTMVAEKLGDGWQAEVDAARAGSDADVWALLNRVFPMEQPLRLAGIQYSPERPDACTWFYWGPTGKRNHVSLVRERGLWHIDYISLL